MFKIDDTNKTVHISRGDGATIEVKANNGEYEFQQGDILKLRIYEKKDYSNPVMEVETTVAKTTTSVNLVLTKENTIIGEDINKPKTYWYEISLNETITIIGYDEDGAKEFIIYPAEKGE